MRMGIPTAGELVDAYWLGHLRPCPLYHDLPAPVGGLRKVADGPNSLAVHRLAATPPLQLGNIPRARLERLPFRHQLAREGLLPWRVAGDDRIVGPNIPVRL